jgi:hypothetical protein
MEVRDILIFEVFLGTVITVVVTVGYGLIAPWYKQAAGRYIFGLLLSLSLLLANTVTGIFWQGLGDGRRVIGAVLFALYIIAISAIGFGIYRAQLNGYRRRKFVEQEKERHRQL